VHPFRITTKEKKDGERRELQFPNLSVENSIFFKIALESQRLERVKTRRRGNVEEEDIPTHLPHSPRKHNERARYLCFANANAPSKPCEDGCGCYHPPP
jgi:hypothetical protein